MRKLAFLALAICLGFSSPVFAAEAPAAGHSTRIGVVDMEAIVTDSDPARAAVAEMESKYSTEKANLEKQNENLQKQAEELKNPKVSEQKKVDFLKARQKLDQDMRNYMRKVEQDELKFRQDLVTMVFNAAYEVARAKGYNFVVDINGGGVLYADRSMDLTPDVMAEVNRIFAEEQSKRGTAPQPAEKPAAENPK